MVPSLPQLLFFLFKQYNNVYGLYHTNFWDKILISTFEEAYVDNKPSLDLQKITENYVNVSHYLRCMLIIKTGINNDKTKAHNRQRFKEQVLLFSIASDTKFTHHTVEGKIHTDYLHNASSYN